MIEMGNLRLVVLSALAVAMLSGCGAGVSDRKAYDDLYANLRHRRSILSTFPTKRPALNH